MGRQARMGKGDRDQNRFHGGAPSTHTPRDCDVMIALCVFLPGSKSITGGHIWAGKYPEKPDGWDSPGEVFVRWATVRLLKSSLSVFGAWCRLCASIFVVR